MKNKKNQNLNSYRENTKSILRPKSVFKKEMGPIKIMSMANTTKNSNNFKIFKKVNDENKDIQDEPAKMEEDEIKGHM